MNAEELSKAFPQKYRDLVMLAMVVLPWAGRAYHSLANGGGLYGMWRAVMFGITQPSNDGKLLLPPK